MRMYWFSAHAYTYCCYHAIHRLHNLHLKALTSLNIDFHFLAFSVVASYQWFVVRVWIISVTCLVGESFLKQKSIFVMYSNVSRKYCDSQQSTGKWKFLEWGDSNNGIYSFFFPRAKLIFRHIHWLTDDCTPTKSSTIWCCVSRECWMSLGYGFVHGCRNVHLTVI